MGAGDGVTEGFGVAVADGSGDAVTVDVVAAGVGAGTAPAGQSPNAEPATPPNKMMAAPAASHAHRGSRRRVAGAAGHVAGTEGGVSSTGTCAVAGCSGRACMSSATV